MHNSSSIREFPFLLCLLLSLSEVEITQNEEKQGWNVLLTGHVHVKGYITIKILNSLRKKCLLAIAFRRLGVGLIYRQFDIPKVVLWYNFTIRMSKFDETTRKNMTSQKIN